MDITYQVWFWFKDWNGKREVLIVVNNLLEVVNTIFGSRVETRTERTLMYIIVFVHRCTGCLLSLPLGIREKPLSVSTPSFRGTQSQLLCSMRPSQALAVPGHCWDAVCAFCSARETCPTDPSVRQEDQEENWSAEQAGNLHERCLPCVATVVSF